MGTDWLARIVVSTVIRRVVGLLLVVVLAWAGIGRAEAANPDTSQCFVNTASDAWCATEVEAYQALSAAIDSAIGSFPSGSQVCGPDKTGPYNDGAYDPSFRIITRIIPASGACSDGGGFTSRTRRWPETGSCPAGTEYNPSTGECFDPSDCLARNADLGSAADQPRPSLVTSRCVAGCKFAMRSDGDFQTTQAPAGAQGEMVTLYRGVMEYTGDVCGVDDPIDPNWNEAETKEIEGQECQGASGWTLCVKKNGDHCMNASNARQFCWTPGETGEKTDANIMQKRNAGDQSIPPNLNLPNGDALVEQQTPPLTTTTITNNTTITTTTQNYTTQNGTNAGGVNQGENADGSGGEGEDGEGDGSTAGGQNCDTPLSVSGGDPVLGEVARQQYMTRCGDGSNPNPDPTEYLGDGSDDPSPEGRVFGGDITFDRSGFGFGTSCPTIPSVNVMGNTIEFNTSVFCEWMQLGGWFVLILTSAICGWAIVKA